jgi:CRISPR system Cascade subunit CasC
MGNVKIGIHTLAAYPPANLNRDEDGRPKTAIVGGTERLRVSSQARKRPWRLSDEIAAIDAGLSKRTRELGIAVRDRMIEEGAAEKLAISSAESIAKQFGSVKKGKITHDENVVYGFEEWDAAMALADRLAKEKRGASEDELQSVPRSTVSVDVAMFGRMRAAQPGLNVDSSIAVSPLLSTHSVAIEADNWTALDDLNPVGSAGMGETEFASAVMYGYVCIDVNSLISNLKGDRETATQSIAALMKVVAMIGPQAMRSRFAQDVLPDLYRVEVGGAVYSHQSAFTEAIRGTSVMAESIKLLREHAEDSSKKFGLELTNFEVSADNPLDVLIEKTMSNVFGD